MKFEEKLLVVRAQSRLRGGRYGSSVIDQGK